MNRWKSSNNRLIGIILGGIISLILISIYSNFFFISNDLVDIFVIINVITLIILFGIAYFIIFTLVKNSYSLGWEHWILINSLIGGIFGLLVGYLSNSGEIYWFVLCFIIISLIPLVNIFAVVFWLGTTIIIYYFPDTFIPIFNDFFPIHLIDSSMNETTGLPLFIIPISLFLGYWIPNFISRYQEKKRLMVSKNNEHVELEKEMKNYQSKIKEWVKEGYNISSLEANQKDRNLSSKIQNLRDYESKINKLKKFEEDLLQLDLKGFEYEVISIKKKFKKPDKVNEIKSDISTLKTRIKDKIEKLTDETDEIIKIAIHNATDNRNSQQLSSLNILFADFHKYLEGIKSIESSYKDIINKIEDVYNQAKTLNFKSERKSEIPTTIHIEKTNYYEIFNIKPNASQEQIKKMFKRLTLAYHPDSKEDTGVDSDQKFRMIIEAYEILKDPDKRKKYDEEIGI